MYRIYLILSVGLMVYAIVRMMQEDKDIRRCPWPDRAPAPWSEKWHHAAIIVVCFAPFINLVMLPLVSFLLAYFTIEAAIMDYRWKKHHPTRPIEED